ncbi:MAG: HAD family hydrolase [Pyrinomonadaceae bacterium]
MKNISIKLFLIISLFCVFSPATQIDAQTAGKRNTAVRADPLPSFNSGTAKTNILNFVTSVTKKNSPNFVKPEDRIAVFDNDGTLWVEQPLTSQLFFVADRIRQMAVNHPEWKNEMPFKAILENDLNAMATFNTADVLKLVGTAQASDNVDEFDPIVREWMKTATHPVMKKPYYELIYQPMLELLQLLKKHQFKIYIVSGGSVEFMRPWAPETYGIPKENIIGTTFKREAIQNGDSIIVKQTTDFEFNDDKLGKVISINRIIGKKPIFIGGNSDGDLAMMQYATTNHNTFCVFVNHTDGEREFLYDDKTLMGTLKAGLPVAQRKGWTIIDMKNDWNRIFP